MKSIKVYINEKAIDIDFSKSAYEIKNRFNPKSDLVILNGYPIKEDKSLKNGDRLVFIEKGKIPPKDDLEALMVARHTPKVHSRVKESRVGIAGVGGLGSNVAIILARLGVGYIKIVDFDVVEPSNLNRQEYLIRDIGSYKVHALKNYIEEINPFIEVEDVAEKIEEDNIEKIFKDVDIVVEAFDDAKAKSLLCNTILVAMKDKIIVAASGMAGYFPANEIVTRRISERFYLCGDGVSEAKENSGLMSPRVSICAGHMANAVLRIILGQGEV